MSEGSVSVKVVWGFVNIWGVCYFRNALHTHKCLWLFLFFLIGNLYVFLDW